MASSFCLFIPLLLLSLLSSSSGQITPNTTSISVTVTDKVAGDPFFNQGWNQQMTLNGQHAPLLTVQMGVTYTFNVNNPSIHPFYIGTSSQGEGAGFLYGGLTSGNFTWTPSASDFASSLFYECENHLLMGNKITILPAAGAGSSSSTATPSSPTSSHATSTNPSSPPSSSSAGAVVPSSGAVAPSSPSSSGGASLPSSTASPSSSPSPSPPTSSTVSPVIPPSMSSSSFSNMTSTPVTVNAAGEGRRGVLGGKLTAVLIVSMAVMALL